MGVLFQEGFFVVVDFFFLFESGACFLRCVVVDVSDCGSIRCFALKVSFASHRLLGVLSYEGSLNCTA